MNKKKTLGLYFGSFDPLHIGHIHIKEKALEILDDVKIVKLINYGKKKSGFPISNQIDIQYGGDFFDIVKKFEDRFVVVIVRGIRNERDFLFEDNLFKDLKDARPDIKIMYILAEEEFRNISSSLIKDLEKENIKQYLI